MPKRSQSSENLRLSHIDEALETRANAMMPESDQDEYQPSDGDFSSSSVVRNISPQAGSDVKPRLQNSQAHAYLAKNTSGEEESDAASFPSSPSPSPSEALGRSRKRRHTLDCAGAPLKRQRSTLNADYLNLLNEDIADASVNFGVDSDSYLKPSQIGATRWTYVEKEVFFSALGRLGRDDLPGIAARIGTKSQLEVQQYLMLLSERERTRRNEGDLRRETLKPADFPAAAELSQDCCIALDQAADDLSLRQESHEEAIEVKKWGDQWLITQSAKTERGVQSQVNMPFAELFSVNNWLQVSERVFMNSRIPDYNWRYLSDEPPAIRATALSDFHALAVSVTKRLVASTLFMSGLRIKAQKEYVHNIKGLVRVKDVKAAVNSLSINAGSRDFWAKAPRRLRLGILQEEENSDDEEEEDRGSDEGIMSYGEVEAALGIHEDKEDSASLNNESPSRSNEDSEEGQSQSEDDSYLESIDVNDESIKRDMREAMFFSADYEGTTRARQSLQGRIETEHRMEAEAEVQDIKASRQEETRLWAILRQPGRPPATPLRNEETDWQGRRAVYEPTSTNWREGLKYISEWEATGTLHRAGG